MNGVNETNKTNTSNELFTADKIEAGRTKSGA